MRGAARRVVEWALRPVLDNIAARHDALATALEISTRRLEEAGEQLRSELGVELARVQDDASRQDAVHRREVSASLDQLAADQQALSGALGELQRHLETRQDQAGVELGELRGALIATRGDLEAVSDRAFPELQGQVAAVDARTGQALVALQADLELVRDRRLPLLEGGQASLHADLAALLQEVEGLRDRRLGQVEQAGERLHAGLAHLQGELERVRDETQPALAARLETTHLALTGVQRLAEELRDARLPALAGRLDALVGRLHEELASQGGLVERLVAGEPLRVEAIPQVETALPEAMRAASRAFADTFRGSTEEISGRLAEHLPLLRDRSPVLELGCGRGEMLRLLQQAGVDARGVDSDPAMVAACQRQGLAVAEGDALELLRAQPEASLGAVVAVHVLEHLPPAVWMSVVEAAARALRTGGVLLVECPNPESLRVGAGLFWVDPTHHSPVHPDALAFVARAVGLEVREVRFAHEFPSEQQLARVGQTPEVRELAERLDAWLSAPRDFVLVAVRPPAVPAKT
ncbi:MAG: methyltransferase domain-containing protein [Thermoanaerobaculaceae bacterium]|nr:methyltransferase domain-containing protein [Thermoanaerobaculaceae bacterium]